MEVILKKDVDKIGKAGAVVKVKDGFARNFLVPNGLAIQVTKESLKSLEQEQQSRVLQQEKIKKEASELKVRLEGLSLTIPALSQEEDKLYASISPHDIALALKEEGIDIDKDSIVIDEPIKSLGIYELTVKLHPELTAKIKVWIVKK